MLSKGYTASDELVKTLQDYVKDVTAPYKYPRVIEFIPELPETSKQPEQIVLSNKPLMSQAIHKAVFSLLLFYIIIHLIHETPTSISGGSLYLLRWG